LQTYLYFKYQADISVNMYFKNILNHWLYS